MTDAYRLVLLVASLPAAAAVGVWAFRRPIRVLGLYFAVLPFGSSIALPIGLPRSFSTISSLLGLAAGAAYLWRWVTERPTLRIPSLSVPLWAVYAALAVASMAWSIRPSVTVANLQVLASLVGLFFVVVITPITRQELTEIRSWIAGGAALTGLYALLLAATGAMPTTGAGVARFQITGSGGGEGGDPNITAAALVVPIAIALSEALNPTRSRRARLGFLVSAGLAGAAVLLTASRGGLLSLAVVGLLIVISHRRGVWSMILLLALVLPAALLVPSTFAERVDNTGTSGRTAIWKLAIDSCPQYCPAGSGFGTFGDVHETAFLTLEGATGNNLRYQAHSIWFEAMIEVGVLGLGLLVAALVVTIRDLARIPVAERGGAMAGLVGLLVANSFLSNLTFKYFWLGLTYAVLVISAGNPRSRPEITRPQTSRSSSGIHAPG